MMASAACCICAQTAFAKGCLLKNRKPNIVLILTDDQRWDAMGCAGNLLARTPNIDKLAAKGTYFQNAFASTPISAASRASILTGMYERSHGYTFGTGPLDSNLVKTSYLSVLRRVGYYVGYFGKLGVDYCSKEKLFDKSEIYDRKDEFNDKRGYFYKNIDGDTVHLTKYTGYMGRKFIEEAPDDRPFCMVLGFSAPHAHDPAPEQYFWQDKSDTLYVDTVFPTPLLCEDHYYMSLPRAVQEGYNRVRWWWRYSSDEQYQHSLRGYYRMIKEIDDEIGELMTLLEQKGISDNTVIIFMSDNGLFLGERQLAGKWLMYEQSIRIPLIIFDPGEKTPAVVNDMALNIDVPSTILSYAGVDIPENYQGIDLTGYIKKNGVESREYILIEHLWDNVHIPSSEGIRTEKWKYFRYRDKGGREELYDMEYDPEETRNLAEYTSYRRILDSLRCKCDAAMHQLL